MFRILCCIVFLVSLISCSSSEKKENAILVAKNNAIKEYINTLSDEVKISQLFLVNIEGNKNFYNVEKTGALYGKRREGVPLVPGGCILFSYNIGDTPEQLFNFIKSIHSFYKENNNPPPYIAIDQEGGDVNRLRKLTSKLPSQKWIAENFSEEQAKSLYDFQAEQLKLLGINMNLAPVVEVSDSFNEKFLDTRTFGTLDDVKKYGEISINSYESHGIATVLKHFPGNSNVDPHTGLPQLFINQKNSDFYLKPFEILLNKSSCVLLSHAIVNITDNSVENYKAMPSCFSEYWVTEYLRNKLKFDGIIFSDDIFMSALADNGYSSDIAVVKAIEAGVDCIMLSEKRFAEVGGILLKKAAEDSVFSNKIDSAVFNIIKYKIKAGLLMLVPISENKRPSFKVKVSDFLMDFDSGHFNNSFKKGTEVFYETE